jgi:hypothetical protein
MGIADKIPGREISYADYAAYKMRNSGSGGNPYGPELYTLANAAADPNGNETDATTGWSQSGLTGTGANVFESQSSVVHTGSYALHTDANDTPTSSARIYVNLQAAPFSFTNGDEGKLEFYARHIGSGATWGAYMSNLTNGSTNLVATILATDTTFIKYSYTWTHDANHQYLLFKEVGINNGGIYLDNISIKKKL